MKVEPRIIGCLYLITVPLFYHKWDKKTPRCSKSGVFLCLHRNCYDGNPSRLALRGFCKAQQYVDKCKQYQYGSRSTHRRMPWLDDHSILLRSSGIKNAPLFLYQKMWSIFMFPIKTPRNACSAMGRMLAVLYPAASIKHAGGERLRAINRFWFDAPFALRPAVSIVSPVPFNRVQVEWLVQPFLYTTMQFRRKTRSAGASTVFAGHYLIVNSDFRKNRAS